MSENRILVQFPNENALDAFCDRIGLRTTQVGLIAEFMPNDEQLLLVKSGGTVHVQMPTVSEEQLYHEIEQALKDNPKIGLYNIRIDMVGRKMGQSTYTYYHVKLCLERVKPCLGPDIEAEMYTILSDAVFEVSFHPQHFFQAQAQGH